MSIILSNNLLPIPFYQHPPLHYPGNPHNLRAQLPQPRIMITTRGNQIRRVRRKRAIPHPPLMLRQRVLQHKLFLIDRPNLCGMVGRTSRKVADVGGKEDARDVLRMRLEFGYGHELRDFPVLDHAPDVAVAL